MLNPGALERRKMQKRMQKRLKTGARFRNILSVQNTFIRIEAPIMCKKTNHPDQSDLFDTTNPQKTKPVNPFSPEGMAEYRRQKEAKQSATLEDLLLLCRTAEGGSGQCHHVRRFLLGLYNCDRWPFELNRLRCLDKKLKDACLTVLELDMCAYQEIHTYIKNGDELFKKWWHEEAGDK